MMALTATATPRVKTDILHQLAMKDPQVFTRSFDRTNLKFSIMKKSPKRLAGEIAETIKKRFKGQSGIIYCLSRKECETVAQDLYQQGIKACPYHAGQSDGERSSIQQSWISGEYSVRFYLCTILFIQTKVEGTTLLAYTSNMGFVIPVGQFFVKNIQTWVLVLQEILQHGPFAKHFKT